MLVRSEPKLLIKLPHSQPPNDRAAGCRSPVLMPANSTLGSMLTAPLEPDCCVEEKFVPQPAARSDMATTAVQSARVTQINLVIALSPVLNGLNSVVNYGQLTMFNSICR